MTIFSKNWGWVHGPFAPWLLLCFGPPRQFSAYATAPKKLLNAILQCTTLVVSLELGWGTYLLSLAG